MLESECIRCWIAPRDVPAGHEWGESILEGIKGSRVMVLILSESANESPHIRREVERAVSLDIAIIPMRIENVAPAKSLELFVTSSHWLDAFTPPMERHLRYLAQVIQKILRGPAPILEETAPTKPPIAKGVVAEVLRAASEMRFQCAQCGENLSVDKSAAGATIRCPHCGEPTLIPDVETKVSPAAPSQFPSRSLSIVFITAILILLGTAAWWFTQHKPNSVAAPAEGSHVEAPKSVSAPATAEKLDPTKSDVAKSEELITGTATTTVSNTPVHAPQAPIPVPAGMALIPEGVFDMGDASDHDANNPPRPVNVSAVFMEKNLVSWDLWKSTRSWAESHGYKFSHSGAGKALNHPVQMVNWFDCVKWCNARSQRTGLKPVYYLDPDFTQVYVSDELNPHVNWDADGFRLPTEAEWEKAARGGLKGKRFPWGDIISWKNANCCGIDASRLDAHYEGPNGWNSAFTRGGDPFTSPIGTFPPNGFGLYDMSGNLLEWCWDWSGPIARDDNPRGPAFGKARIIRGGSWKNTFAERCAWRASDRPEVARNTTGFRCARSVPKSP